MDIENFNQCIQYLQSSGSGKTTLERYLPVFAALSGGLAGFLLNYLSAGRKEARSDKNKIMCCNEDVEKTQEILKHTILEVMKMTNALVQKKRITTHTLPNKINTLCLSKYFTEIAHKYTKTRRLNIQLLLENIEALNEHIIEAHEPKKGFVSYENSVTLLNVSSKAMKAWFCCQGITADEEVTSANLDADSESIKIGATLEQLEARNKLIENLKSNNTLINLPI